MTYILRIQAPDEKALIYKITSLLQNFNITKNNEFVDFEQRLFFFRAQFTGEGSVDGLREQLLAILPPQSEVSIEPKRSPKLILLCTKENHCLGDILLRRESSELDVQILGVIGNHDTLRPLVERFEIPFFTISHENCTREEHEQKLLDCIAHIGQADILVLAKYMRILSPEFVAHFRHRILNIHHSLLPAFVGANPYKQAHNRGAKIIGATAHFVTDALDEGPIIAQDIIKIDHNYTIKDMQQAGHDIEKIVLARALKLVCERRVFVYQNKTIIF